VTTLAVVGAGGHGREAHAVARAVAAWDDVRLYDDQPGDAERLARLGVVVSGPVRDAVHADELVIAVGDPSIRHRIDTELGAHAGAVLVDPSARIGTDVELADGVMVYPQAVITTNVRIGRHSHVNCGSIVSHDCRIGAHVSISPGVRLNGDVTIEDGVFLGTGAIVIPGVAVGQGAVVGAGAVVTSDVAPGTTVVGVPAR